MTELPTVAAVCADFDHFVETEVVDGYDETAVEATLDHQRARRAFDE